MEVVPTIVIAASACARDPACMCELCTEADGWVTPIPWRGIAAMECSTNPDCPCESCAYEEEDHWYDGPMYLILDLRLGRELLANQQEVLSIKEVDLPPRDEGPLLRLRYVIHEYWSGRIFGIRHNQEPPIFDADGDYLGYTNEE